MSDYSKSTNFTAKDTLPTGNSGKIVKGTELDVEFTAIASSISSKADISSPALLGTPTVPTATTGTNTTQIASTAFVQTALSAAFTSGMILLWSGSVASIPSGWYLCNGANGTPNLQNRFVVGAGSTYAVAATGGSADSVVVSHTHTATVTDSGHSHTFVQMQSYAGTIQVVASDRISQGNTIVGTQTSASNIINSNTTGITVANSTTGVSGTNANLPPYYALAYIMKS